MHPLIKKGKRKEKQRREKRKEKLVKVTGRSRRVSYLMQAW